MARASPTEKETVAAVPDTMLSSDPRGSGANPMDGVIGYRLRRAQVASFQDFLLRFKEVNLRPAEFSVLHILNEQPGLKHAEVARMLGIKRANFVPLMDALENRGLAERMKSGTDRRSHALHLTDGGRAVLQEAKKLFRKHEADLVRKLGGPEARDTLIDLLSRLVDD